MTQIKSDTEIIKIMSEQAPKRVKLEGDAASASLPAPTAAGTVQNQASDVEQQQQQADAVTVCVGDRIEVKNHKSLTLFTPPNLGNCVEWSNTATAWTGCSPLRSVLRGPIQWMPCCMLSSFFFYKKNLLNGIIYSSGGIYSMEYMYRLRVEYLITFSK